MRRLLIALILSAAACGSPVPDGCIPVLKCTTVHTSPPIIGRPDAGPPGCVEVCQDADAPDSGRARR